MPDDEKKELTQDEAKDLIDAIADVERQEASDIGDADRSTDESDN